MSAAAGMTGYDLVVIGFFALLVLRGVWLGFLKQITGLVALYLGYIAAVHYHDRIFPFLKGISANPKLVFFAAYVLLFVVAYVAVMLVGKGLAYVMKLTVAGWFDRLLGGLLGAAKALLLIIIIHMVLTVALPQENRMLTTCRTCNALNKTTVAALELIKDKDIKRVLDRQQSPISSRDIKGFFDDPPKSAAAPVTPVLEKPDPGQPPAPAVDPPHSQGSSPVQ